MGRGKVLGEPIKGDCQQHARGDRQERPEVDAALAIVKTGIAVDKSDQQRANDRNRGRQIEAAIHRAHRVALGVRGAHNIGADDRGDHADAARQQREDQVIRVEGAPARYLGSAQHNAQDHRGHNGDLKRLENVGGHARAVTNVVAHQVGDHGRVARIVFRQIGFDFAHKVGADIGSFGIDAAADAHKQRDQRAAKAEAEQRIRRRDTVKQKDQRAAQQPQSHGQHAGNGARPVRNFKRLAVASARSRGHPHIRCHRHGHSDIPYGVREERAHQKRNGSADPDRHDRVITPDLFGFGGRWNKIHAEEQQDRQHRNGDGDRPELTAEIRVSTVPNPAPYLAHTVGARLIGQDLAS